MDQTLEQWRPVVGYEGLYEVSSLGRVRSVARTCSTKGGAQRQVRQRILVQAPDSRDYMAVSLSKYGEHKTARVCRLVAAAFIGPRPEGHVVCHGANGKFDDSLANLSYKTQLKNMEDKLRDGTHGRGERHYGNKLTQAQVVFARKVTQRTGVSCACLARAWGVSASTVSKAVSGKNWSWLDA